MNKFYSLPLLIFLSLLFHVSYGQNQCVDLTQIDLTVFCIDLYDPVCGCDGMTYANSCIATNYFGVTSFTPGSCTTIPVPPCTDLVGVDFGLCDMVLGVGVVNGSCTYISGCSSTQGNIDYSPALYTSIAECELGCGNPNSCVDPLLIDNAIACTQEFVPVCGCDGVTYMNSCVAVYFNGVSSWTPGPCVTLGGCTYPSATNYQLDAMWDNGTCVFPVCNTGCNGDVNGDNSVSVNDILILLGNFGAICL